MYGMGYCDDSLAQEATRGQEFERLAPAHGIGNGTALAPYGDLPNWLAACLFWPLRMYGYDDVYLVDGGRTGWGMAGRGRTREGPEVRPASNRAASAGEPFRAYLDDLHGDMRERRVRMADARSAAECSGKMEAAPGAEGVAETDRAGRMREDIGTPWTVTANGGDTIRSCDGLRGPCESRGAAPGGGARLAGPGGPQAPAGLPRYRQPRRLLGRAGGGPGGPGKDAGDGGQARGWPRRREAKGAGRPLLGHGLGRRAAGGRPSGSCRDGSRGPAASHPRVPGRTTERHCSHGDSGAGPSAAVSRYTLATALAVAALIVCLALAVPHEASGDTPGQPGRSSPEKFDHGFYDRILAIIAEEGGSAEPGPGAREFPEDDLEYAVRAASEGIRHYRVVVIVSGDDQEAVDRNKAALVEILEGMGARDIYPGRALSFVVASVPVDSIPSLSAHGEVAAIGDGEAPIVPDLDRARRVIRATPDDLAALSDQAGSAINGTGVMVAVLDNGINSVYLNDRVVASAYCRQGGCSIVNGTLMGNHTLHPANAALLTANTATHGTRVAHVIAASGLSARSGIAPGVGLMDAHTAAFPGYGLLPSLDWAVEQGADVLNTSLSLDSTRRCPNSNALIINDAVERGVVFVHSAGNYGFNTSPPYYRYGEIAGCATNQIVVGGVNGLGSIPRNWLMSSKGPFRDDFPRMAPHLVAPSANLQVSVRSTGQLGPQSGTSLAAPLVSGAAALLLQLRPELVPAETKSLLLLGANWTGPVPCSSRQYETADSGDNCSHAAKPGYPSVASAYLNGPDTLKPLNHAGFGILDVSTSISYALNHSSHMVSSDVGPGSSPATYGLNVTGPPATAKVILNWLVGKLVPGDIADLNLAVSCPGPGDAINASSTYQIPEFAVFQPGSGGVCAVRVSGEGVNGTSKRFTLAATHSLLRDAPSSLAVWGITVSSASDDGTYYRDDPVLIGVAFPRAVAVSDGSPPYLTMDTGGRATYTGIDGAGRVLSFEYRVGQGHSSADLDYNGTDALILPASDSITDAHTGVPLAPVPAPAPGIRAR